MREKSVGAENRRHYSNPGKSGGGLVAVTVIRSDSFLEIF